MLMEKERNEIVEYGKKICSLGLTSGTSGNLSCYDPDTGYMAISPSGIGYFDMVPEDIVIMDLDGNIIEGTRRPSSENRLHSAVYRHRKEARGVVHVHSIYCTTFACLRQPIKAVHYAISGSNTDEVPCIDYDTFGTAGLANKAEGFIENNNVLLLANHGLLATGGDLSKAFSLAVNVEFVAQIQWRCISIGTPVVLSSEQMDDVRVRMKTYGQPKKAGEVLDTVGY